jgi:cell division topological specificity factor
MNLLDLFRFPAKRSAQAAKERLQIIVQHESARHRGGDGNNDFIKKLQKELLDVISKYVNIDPENIKVQLERTGDYSVLELNVTLPEFHERPTPAVTPAIAEVEAKAEAEKTTEETAVN